MKLKLSCLIGFCLLLSSQLYGHPQQQKNIGHINALYYKHLRLLKEPTDQNEGILAEKTVAYVSPDTFKYTIKRGNKTLVFFTDYEFGELSYEKTFNDVLYQSGKFYFTPTKEPAQQPTIKDFGTLAVDDFSVAKGSCGGHLSTLNEIMDLMEDLIDSGVDPQSSLIGNLMSAALSALRDLMTCMQR